MKSTQASKARLSELKPVWRSCCDRNYGHSPISAAIAAFYGHIKTRSPYVRCFIVALCLIVARNGNSDELRSSPGSNLTASLVRVMPLGDSITEGFRDGFGDDLNGGYRRPLFQILARAGYSVHFICSKSAGSNAHPETAGW